jgi:hypothetical protein
MGCFDHEFSQITQIGKYFIREIRAIRDPKLLRVFRSLVAATPRQVPSRAITTNT